MRYLAFLLACVLCISACSSGPRRALDEAEDLMSSRPDSALAILQGIPQESLRTQGLQARWSLLYTAAQDKNSITIQNDTPVQAAYEFYHRHGPQADRMRAAYYWGVVKQTTGDTAEATFLFKEAEQLAEKLEDNHFLGLAREHLCALHANNYDIQTALEYASKAVEAFDRAGEKLSADFSRMDVARQSYNLGDRQRAIEIADSLLAYNRDADPGLRYTLLVLRADIHYWDQEFEQARERYEQAMSLGYPLSLLGIGNMAIIKERAGQHAAADSCLRVISKQMTEPYDSTVYYSCQNKIQLLRGEYKDAYASAEEAMRLQNEDVRNELSRSLTRTQKAYFEERYISENAHNKILVLWFVLIATLLSIIILATYFALQRHKKQAIKEMERVEGLSMELSLLQERQKGAGAVLSLMVQDKIRAMQDLTDTYFSWTNEALSPRKESSGKQQKEDIIAQFRSELRSLRKDDQFIPNIEKALDLNCRGIISRLRSTFSDTSEHKMKELDFQLLVLFFAKFTPQSISFILDMTEESVRTRKSRYKKLFLSMGEAGSDFANSLS
jgi:hypothetical protein